jgi:hypothetical protein
MQRILTREALSLRTNLTQVLPRSKITSKADLRAPIGTNEVCADQTCELCGFIKRFARSSLTGSLLPTL